MGKGKNKASSDNPTFDNDQLGENKSSNGGGKTKNKTNKWLFF